jgi:competence protein ComEA
MKTRFQTYFSFSKKEMNGIWVLCLLILLILISPVVYQRFEKPDVYNFVDFDHEMQNLLGSERNRQPEWKYSVRNAIEDREFRPAYFKFNPNKLPDELWQKLGLSVKQIRVIKNYESKGGRFFKKEDLQKIYSISDKQYALLEPYIHIPVIKRFRDPSKFFDKKNAPASHPSSQSRDFQIVELNSADSTSLESVRGIGPAFAARIIKFRNKLGGFHKKEQLLDVYGIDSGFYEKLKKQVTVDETLVLTINVNTASFEELKRHPYLTYKQMNAILQYRKQHGSYSSIEDLRRIAILNDEILRKIGPYLTF